MSMRKFTASRKENKMNEQIEEYVKTIKEIEEREGLSEAKVSKVALMNITNLIDKFSKEMDKKISKEQGLVIVAMQTSEDQSDIYRKILDEIENINITLGNLEKSGSNIRDNIKKLI